jgi:hypothetical protein
MPAPTHPIADQLAWLAIQPVEDLTREACVEHLAELGRVSRFVDGLHTRYAARLDAVSPTPEADHSQSTRGSRSSGRRASRRGRGRNNTGAAGQVLGNAMDHGAVSGEHLDVFLSIQATLPLEVRHQFCSNDEQIAGWATQYDVEAFGRLLRAFADELRRLHGISRLDQQRRDTYLDTWVDQTGMVRVSAAFDPESGLAFRTALSAMVETLHHDATPPHCPDDPAARQRFLRAHAFLRLLQHGPTCSGRNRAELVIIADTTQLDSRGQPSIDWGLPVELPLEALARFYRNIDRTTIIDITKSGTIRDLGSQLDLGRTTRLANRAQRRLLRALHPTCVVPGCATPFQQCHIHHVHWWRYGGLTNLSNLAPLCNTHHQRIHNDQWQLTIDDQRRISVTLPDGALLEGTHLPPHFDLAMATLSSLSP